MTYCDLPLEKNDSLFLVSWEKRSLLVSATGYNSSVSHVNMKKCQIIPGGSQTFSVNTKSTQHE